MQGGFIMFGGWLGSKHIPDGPNIQESNIIAKFDESTYKWSKVVLKFHAYIRMEN